MAGRYFGQSARGRYIPMQIPVALYHHRMVILTLLLDWKRDAHTLERRYFIDFSHSSSWLSVCVTCDSCLLFNGCRRHKSHQHTMTRLPSKQGRHRTFHFHRFNSWVHVTVGNRTYTSRKLSPIYQPESDIYRFSDGNWHQPHDLLSTLAAFFSITWLGFFFIVNRKNRPRKQQWNRQDVVDKRERVKIPSLGDFFELA